MRCEALPGRQHRRISGSAVLRHASRDSTRSEAIAYSPSYRARQDHNPTSRAPSSNLAEAYAILDDRARPYYEHALAA